MRVVKSDSSKLILKSSGLLFLIIGLLVIFLGIAMFARPSWFEETSPLMAVLIILFGGIFVVFASWRTTIIDKNAGTIIITTFSLLDKRKTASNSIKSVEAIILQKHPDNSRRQSLYSLSWKLANGEEDLTEYRTSHEKKVENMGLLISNFLGVPFEHAEETVTTAGALEVHPEAAPCIHATERVFKIIRDVKFWVIIGVIALTLIPIIGTLITFGNLRGGSTYSTSNSELSITLTYQEGHLTGALKRPLLKGISAENCGPFTIEGNAFSADCTSKPGLVTIRSDRGEHDITWD